jgi:hypothetical protein
MTRTTRATPAGVPRSRAKRTREQRGNPYPFPYGARPTPKQRRGWRDTRKGVKSYARQMRREWDSQAHKNGGTQ